MSKQHITETLVCGNCIHSSPAPGYGRNIRRCQQNGYYVNRSSTFCDYFVADWILQVQNDLQKLNVGQLEKGVLENERT